MGHYLSFTHSASLAIHYHSDDQSKDSPPYVCNCEFDACDVIDGLRPSILLLRCNHKSDFI